MNEERKPNPNILASRITGTSVHDADGTHIGHVEDLVIGKREGRVSYAILSVGGFLGIGSELHPLPWDKLAFNQDQGGYTVDVTRKELEEAPRYAPESEPDWDDIVWGRAVYDYYGIPPYF
ncbi:PRC-barrel domain-containing protein [Pararhizobium mangrovi]|uniref:PRC-barrel domain containing protein n=1 Tax=Pararhizobium mangrovi TaxID=2590452 RepID=A0A506U1E7_9HYPH|nr:PRC-barrel domain-containing protein [Pararhizobium mangrovi]TPW26814.1 PRC-barrel domain containing protein [Pararhizobium mangrovi]